MLFNLPSAGRQWPVTDYFYRQRSRLLATEVVASGCACLGIACLSPIYHQSITNLSPIYHQLLKQGHGICARGALWQTSSNLRPEPLVKIGILPNKRDPSSKRYQHTFHRAHGSASVRPPWKDRGRTTLGWLVTGAVRNRSGARRSLCIHLVRGSGMSNLVGRAARLR
jgi:hypothetical protein